MRRIMEIALWGLVLFGMARCTPALPPRPLHIQVTGEEYTWQFRYSGPDGALQTADDIIKPGKELHLPLGRGVELELTQSRLHLHFRPAPSRPPSGGRARFDLCAGLYPTGSRRIRLCRRPNVRL